MYRFCPRESDFEAAAADRKPSTRETIASCKLSFLEEYQ